jgi:multidrug efflux pump
MNHTKHVPKYPWYSMFVRSGHLLFLSITIIIVAGMSAINTLPRLEDPRIDLRYTLILTMYPGASAQRVEALVSDVLEDELRELYEIKKIESISKAGFSLLTVELQDWVDNTTNQQILGKIRDRVDDASQRFPPGAMAPVMEDNRGATAYTVQYAISPVYPDTMPTYMATRFAQEFADNLRNVSGTEVVNLYGATQEEITVNIHPNKLALVGLTAQDVSDAIAGADPKLPAGVVFTDHLNLRVQVAQVLESLDVINNIPLLEHQGDYLRVADVADVTRGVQSPRSTYALVNAQPVVMVAARMQTNVRVDQWTEQIKAKAAVFEQMHGASIDIALVFEQNRYTEARLNELTGNLLLGCMVVMLVILIFMGWKASWIVGLSLPLSAFFAVFSLGFFGESIHQMSIFGVIIAIGLLIDNAIVITDEIRQNLLIPGISRVQALVKSVSHLFVPLLASTLTTILGFMPIFLLNGNIGDFISSIAISVVMALFGSFWISLSIIAALAARFLPRGHADNTPWYVRGLQGPQLSNAFRVWLGKALHQPLVYIPAIVLICVVGFVLAGRLANVFFPSADRDQFAIEVILPVGTNIETTYALTQDIDAHIKNYEGIEQTQWLIGSSIPTVYYNQVMNRDNSPEYANGVITVDTMTRATMLIDTLQSDLQASYPQAKVIVKAFGQGPPIPAPVEVDVYGPDLNELERIGRDIRAVFAQTPGISQSTASITLSEPEVTINTTRDQVSLAGLSLNELSGQLQLALNGQIGGSIVEQTEEIPIRIRISDEQRSDLTHLAALPLASRQYDIHHPFLQVAALGDFTISPSLSGITRKDSERVNRIQGFLLQGVPAVTVSNQIMETLKDYPLPPGYRIKMAGDADKQNEALGQLGTYAPVLLVMMITTLILSFQSLRFAASIGSVAILSVGLGMLSLWLSGLPIGFNPLLGCAGLIGVAINGSIVVIAAIKANPQALAGNTDAIVDETMGCSRHILSTTFTTVGGFIPLLLFTSGSFWPPLAVVLAGGVGFSVILSLVYTPVLIGTLCRIRQRKVDRQHIKPV